MVHAQNKYSKEKGKQREIRNSKFWLKKFGEQIETSLRFPLNMNYYEVEIQLKN